MAEKSYRRAIGHLEAIWIASTSVTDIGAVAFGEVRQAPYRELVDLLIEQSQANEGLNMAEQARSRTLLSLIAARHGKQSPAPAGQSEMLHALSRSISSLRTRLLANETSPGERAKIEREIEESESALHEARVNLDMQRSTERLVWSRPHPSSRSRRS